MDELNLFDRLKFNDEEPFSLEAINLNSAPLILLDSYLPFLCCLLRFQDGPPFPPVGTIHC